MTIIMCTLIHYTVIVQIIYHPASVVVRINSTLTLTCNATGSGPIRYQWRRVNGEISNDRAEGVNTSTLTTSPFQQEDEDEYYCVASNGGLDGLSYSDISDKALVILYGKKFIITDVLIAYYPNQNTPGVKKVEAKDVKKAMLKKM